MRKGGEGRGLSQCPGAGFCAVDYIGPFVMPYSLILFDDDWFGIIQC